MEIPHYPKTLTIPKDTDRDAFMTGWFAVMSPAGEVVIVPVLRPGPHAEWRVAAGPTNQTFVIQTEYVCKTEGDALSRARASVGLARIEIRGHNTALALEEEEKKRLRAMYSIEVKHDLRESLRPVIEERMMLQAERAAFAREKENMTMARRDEAGETEAPAESSLLGKAKAAGTKAISTVKTDAQRAAIRTVARQIVTGARKALLKFLADKGVGQKARGPIEEIIDSQAGKMMIGYTLGTIVPLVPGLSGRPIVIAAGEELRVEAMSLGLDSVFEGLSEYVFPDVIKSVKALEDAAGKPGASSSSVGQSERDADFATTT